MNQEDTKILVLENNEEYTVVDSFVINNRKYLFLIGNSKKDLALVENNNGRLKSISSEEEYNQVFNLLYERNKKEIDKILKENGAVN